MPAEHRLPEIRTPDSIRDNPDALELMRAWWAGDHAQMVFRPIFEDPRAFGFVLAEASKHLARVYAEAKGMDPYEAHLRILEGWADGQHKALNVTMEVSDPFETAPS